MEVGLPGMNECNDGLGYLSCMRLHLVCVSIPQHQHRTQPAGPSSRRLAANRRTDDARDLHYRGAPPLGHYRLARETVRTVHNNKYRSTSHRPNNHPLFCVLSLQFVLARSIRSRETKPVSSASAHLRHNRSRENKDPGHVSILVFNCCACWQLIVNEPAL
jgi:hypothetical protein